MFPPTVSRHHFGLFLQHFWPHKFWFCLNRPTAPNYPPMDYLQSNAEISRAKLQQKSKGLCCDSQLTPAQTRNTFSEVSKMYEPSDKNTDQMQNIIRDVTRMNRGNRDWFTLFESFMCVLWCTHFGMQWTYLVFLKGMREILCLVCACSAKHTPIN